ncbi:MAG: maleylacetoacetate isomerase, partial [Pseudomonadota bacterium]
MKLHGYWRSSAAYRLRIALNLKELSYKYIPIDIRTTANEQLSSDFRAINPQGRVPVLEVDGIYMSQSMAILEWLEERYPDPAFLPTELLQRQKVRAFADTIACDIHPLNNLSVLNALRGDFDATDDQVQHWYKDWITRGFGALEQTVSLSTRTDNFLFGDTPGLAEICLVPQVWNAR